MNKDELNKSVLGLLLDLHAFNQLNKRIVDLITLNFGIDAVKLCREEGITYDID